MKLYNTLTRKVDEFKPLNPPKVGIYSCGPTVYDYQHIGHARTYVFADVLKKSLRYLGYDVKQVMNITDVGHLVSDADEGEDKMEKAAREKGKTPQELAEFYAQDFFAMLKKLNWEKPKIVCWATNHIQEMIDLVKTLEKKGYLYRRDDGLYFDITKFPDYGQLGGFDWKEMKAGARVPVREQKKNPQDFAVWKFAHEHHLQQWDSPWGRSFPGWHIECSAMSMKYLGDQFDIHTGGVDHIQVHHNNEIAQSEAATGKKPFVQVWMHAGHLHVDGKKMSKSLKNYLRLSEVVDKGYESLALRYLFLTTHYRRFLNFTWESLDAAASGLKNLRSLVTPLMEVYDTSKNNPKRTGLSKEKLKKIQDSSTRFKAALENDLKLPEALAVTWEVLKSNIPSPDKLDLIRDFDQVLGLDLLKLLFKGQSLEGLSLLELKDLPDEIQQLVNQRERARQNQDWKKADQLREKIKAKDWLIEDTPAGPKLKFSNKVAI